MTRIEHGHSARDVCLAAIHFARLEYHEIHARVIADRALEEAERQELLAFLARQQGGLDRFEQVLSTLNEPIGIRTRKRLLTMAHQIVELVL